MTDWSTIASLSTAGGTLVLAVATFSSVRSSQRSARVAERALMLGLRPVLAPAREDDPRQRIAFGDGVVVSVEGGCAAVIERDGRFYIVISLRNVGSGLAVLHSSYILPRSVRGADPHQDPDDFQRLTRDIYVPVGGTGFWQGALRDTEDERYQSVRAALDAGEGLSVDLLYGDEEGGQRTITRFGLRPPPQDTPDEPWISGVTRHWRLDGPDPR
jgi:hypothetical protein